MRISVITESDSLEPRVSATPETIKKLVGLGATVTVQADSPGSISFYHQESTESGYDYLQFYVNGAMQGQWSGITAWQLATYPLNMGTNQLEWRYSKDGSLSGGTDSVFVDDITAMNGYIP